MKWNYNLANLALQDYIDSPTVFQNHPFVRFYYEFQAWFPQDYYNWFGADFNNKSTPLFDELNNKTQMYFENKRELLRK